VSPEVSRGALALALALVPGAVSYALGLRLRRNPDDPALAERLLKQRQLVLQLGVLAVAFLLLGLRAEATWALPLLLVATLGLGFPARRALLSESWGLGAYLVHVGRLALAGLGFWVLLAVAPQLAAPGGATAAIAAGALVAWGLAYGPLFTWLLGARPVVRPDLESRFAAILARARTPAPRLLVAGHPGARWANAFALPSLLGSRVLLTRTLLQDFDPVEIGGVFAHEVAHLEHHGRARQLGSAASLLLLAAVAVWGVPRAAGLAWGAWVSWLWPLLILVGLAVRAARHQSHEADSDRRAVELLGGDPEPLARALVKLHAIGRLPRRFEPRMEASASHPSLARRLQALRGTAAAQEPGPTVLESVRAGAVVVLDAERSHWLEGVPADAPRDAALRERAARVRSIAYSELSSLHVQVGLVAGPRLRATDRAGRTWSEPLRAADVARAQAALDGIDSRLGAANPSPLRRPVASLLCLTLLLAGLLADRVGVYILPAVVGALAPVAPVLLASGAGALAALAGEGPSLATGLPSGPAAPWALAATALTCVGIGVWRGRAAESAPRWPVLVAAAGLALFALLLGAGIALGSLQPPRLVRLHLLASERPGAAEALVGLAALVVGQRRHLAGAALALPGLVLLGFGSPGVAALLVPDPMLAPIRALPIQERRLPVLARVELTRFASEARLSPDGSTWAVREAASDPEALDGDEAEASFRVGRFGGASRALAAADLVLIDADQALRVRSGPTALALERLALDHEDVAWGLALPRFAGPRLSLNRDGAWSVAGWSYDERRFSVASGRLGEPGVAWRDAGPTPPGRPAPQLVAGADQALLIAHRLEQGPLWIASAMLGMPPMSVEVAWLGGPTLATTPLDVRCVARRDEHDFVCSASYDGRSRFLRLAPGSTAFEPLGQLAERAYWEQVAPRGRLCARLAGGAWADIDFRRGSAIKLDFEDARPIVSLAFADAHVAALGHLGDRAVLTLHPLP